MTWICVYAAKQKRLSTGRTRYYDGDGKNLDISKVEWECQDCFEAAMDEHLNAPTAFGLGQKPMPSLDLATISSIPLIQDVLLVVVHTMEDEVSVLRQIELCKKERILSWLVI